MHFCQIAAGCFLTYIYSFLRAALRSGSSPAAEPVVPGQPFEICAPFHVWSPGYCIHAILYVAPFVIFNPLLRNPSDGPDYGSIIGISSDKTLFYSPL